jgi:hypothetical protein
MGARLDWLLREVTVVGALNVLAFGPVAVLHASSVRLDGATTAACSATTLLVLTVLNVASARSHAREGALLSWPVFAILEALSVIAAASWWAVAS